MDSPSAPSGDAIYTALLRRGLTRRAFLRFSAAMAAALALPASYAPRIADAVASSSRLPVVWLRGQACGGDTAAFLHSAKPTTTELLLDLLSVDYHPTLMASAGSTAEQARADLLGAHPSGYIAVVEGAIPTSDDGVYATIGGRSFRDVVAEVCAGAIGTIAVGSCAFDGGAPAAGGGRTGATGVAGIVSGARVVSLPGCPVNVENLAATIVHYLTFHEFPVTDGRGRPLFAYGGLVHNQCERRAHFEFGEFVLAWGDEGAQKGWCLYKLGCKGPETFANCPTVRYAQKASWSVKAGHGCIGCTMPGFWDAMGTAYRRLPSPIPFLPGVTADQVGEVLVGGVGAMTLAHGAASFVRSRRNGAAERHGASPASSALAPAVERADMPSIEPPTEPWTEPTPEPWTEPTPEPWTEPTPERTEPTPEPPTEPWTEPTPEPPVEPGTEPLTRPNEPPVEPGTEPWTRPNEPPVEPVGSEAHSVAADPEAD